ncbi:MAG TPA: ABC transporter permease [Anaerolineaceae bacterium]|nr:ABC transporter permease [Anaerolineaceae bacterium]
MNIGQYFIEAIESLTSNKLRSGLTILGIVIGVAAVISMMAIGQGAQNSISSSINNIGTNVLFISSGNRNQNVHISNPKPLLLSDVTALSDTSQVPDVVYVTASLRINGNVSAEGQTTSTEVMGVSPAYATVRNLAVADGEFLTEANVTSRSAVAVIGSDVATNLFNTTQDLVGKTIRIQGQQFKVIGVLESKGGGGFGSQDNQILIPITTAQSRLTHRGTANEVDQILVSAVSADKTDAATAEVTAILRSRHKLADGAADDFTILSQSDLLSTASSITGTLTLFLGGVGGISLLVGGIGIMNIMLVSVTERTREIGLRKALGARRRDIRIQFLMESLLLSLLGGAIGVLLAWGISAIIAQVASSSGTAINPVISINAVLLATLFSAAVGLFFGLYPANRASNLQPVEALRAE